MNNVNIDYREDFQLQQRLMVKTDFSTSCSGNPFLNQEDLKYRKIVL